jgi:hypothetical protein
VKLLDDGVEDAVQMPGQDLRRALGAELIRKRLGECGEAGDVGEQRGTVDALGKGAAGGDRAAPITGDVRGGPVECDR